MKRTRALALFVSVLAIASACSSEERTAPQEQAPAVSPSPAAARPSPPVQLHSSRVRGYKGPLPAIPDHPYAAAPREVVRAVYEFAARRPDVLRYMPCFCGCERNGHKGNEDCFVASRDAEGRPTWDSHGLT